MTDIDKVVFAEEEMTIHIELTKPVKKGGETFYSVHSELLLPGQTVDFNSLPKYLQDDILNDKVKGLRLLTEEEVAMRLEERDKVLAMYDDDSYQTEGEPTNLEQLQFS